MRKLIVLVGILALVPAGVSAQAFEWLRGGTYDGSIPTPQSVLGHEIGSYFTDHHQMVDYIHKLAAATDKVKVFKYGQSEERRDLYLIAIGSPENMRRLEEIRTTIARLTDPRALSPAEAEAIIKQTPAIAWANFGTDGQETTATEAAMQLAYQLAAGRDPLTTKILSGVVTIINPCASPDAFQRYVTWMKAVTVGRRGAPSPDASEHHGDWLMETPLSHFGIDVNRDAFALSTAVTRATAEALHHWNPQTWIDNHGTPNQYYFAPFSAPVNLNYPSTALKWATEIGKNNARYFDRYGWNFYKDENFDLYYPGYWDSYPALNGAIGATYETDGGGNKGLVYRLPDNTLTTLRDGIHHHFTANMATLEVVADNREAILRDFYNFRKVGMDEVAKEQFKTYVLLPGADKGRLNDLVELLLRHKIELYRTDASVSSKLAQTYFDRTSKPRDFPPGSYVIPLAQPQKRMVKALFEPDPRMEETFMKAVEERRARDRRLGTAVPKEGYGFYDVTAWAPPLTWGIDASFTEDALPVVKERLVTQKPDSTGAMTGGRAGYAYLFSYDTDGGARLAGRLLQEGYNVAIATREFKNSGQLYPRGTLVARVQRNPPGLHTRIEELAKTCGAQVTAVNTGWAETGVSFGSRYVRDLEKPRVLVVTDAPTAATGYGAIHHLLSERFDLDFTPVRGEYFASVDLSDYNVIILPDGSAAAYEQVLREEGIANLKAWVRSGGTLVAVKGGAAFTTRKGVELTDVKLMTEVPDKTAEKPPDGDPSAKTPMKAIESIPGAIFRATVNNDYYLGLGYPQEIAVQLRGGTYLSKTVTGANVVTIGRNAWLSGHKWEDTEEIVADKLYLGDVPVGRGHVILFGDDPTYRAFWRGLDRLFLSSILLAPAY